MRPNNIYIRQILRSLLLLLVLYFLIHLGKDWFIPQIIKGLGGYTAKETKTVIDTTSIRRDTIYLPSKIRKVKVIIKDPTKKVILVKESLTSLDTIKTKKIYEYNLALNDSLIEGNINTTVDLVSGKILTQDLKYYPKFPIIIKEYVNVEKKITETLFDKPRVHIGGGIIGSANGTLGGVVVYQTRKKVQFQVGYSIYVTPTSAIIPRDNSVISFSIIKLF
jgi:hypothetical protein